MFKSLRSKPLNPHYHEHHKLCVAIKAIYQVVSQYEANSSISCFYQELISSTFKRYELTDTEFETFNGLLFGKIRLEKEDLNERSKPLIAVAREIFGIISDYRNLCPSKNDKPGLYRKLDEHFKTLELIIELIFPKESQFAVNEKKAEYKKSEAEYKKSEVEYKESKAEYKKSKAEHIKYVNTWMMNQQISIDTRFEIWREYINKQEQTIQQGIKELSNTHLLTQYEIARLNKINEKKFSQSKTPKSLTKNKLVDEILKLIKNYKNTHEEVQLNQHKGQNHSHSFEAKEMDMNTFRIFLSLKLYVTECKRRYKGRIKPELYNKLLPFFGASKFNELEKFVKQKIAEKGDSDFIECIFTNNNPNLSLAFRVDIIK